MEYSHLQRQGTEADHVRNPPFLARQLLDHDVLYISDMLCVLPVCLHYLLCFLPMFAVHLPAGIPINNFISLHSAISLLLFLY